MDGGLFFLGLLIALFALYRVVSRKLATPQAVVRALLRRYHAFAYLGLPEQDCLYRVLTSRSCWRDLPPAFVAEIVARLKSKESTSRFVALAEEHRFHRKQLPVIARNPDRKKAMREVALWLGDFGNRLQEEDRLKEAEFVQKLALELLPDQSSTLLPLAATYYKMERYSDAVSLFKRGLVRVETSANSADSSNGPSDGNTDASMSTYEEMYAVCLKGGERQPKL
jgi:hypothetical protein